MRVLHFVSTPSRGSGVMSVIMNYYRHIDRDKVQFDFLCFIQCEESYEEEIKNLGGNVYYIPRPGLSGKAVRELKKFLEEHRKEYAWMHNHEVYLSFLLEPLARKYGIPGFIIHSHATKYSDRPLGAVRNRLLCLPIRRMKSSAGFRVQRFACSRAAGRFLYGDHQMKQGGVYVLHNAIDCERFRFDPEKRERIRRDLGLEDQFVIGHVGRFERQKNHEFLIKVFAECKRQRANSVLLLVGEGSLRPKIEDQVNKLGLRDSVIFLGQRDDVSCLYQAMDAFALPSLYEGIGISLLEAQACGIPCIASDFVPNEVSAGQIKFLSINQNFDIWSRNIEDTKKRNSESDIIQERCLRSQENCIQLSAMGYNIKRDAVCLEYKYLEGSGA